MKRILIFGGTTEGRELAQKLSEQGYPVTVSVATDLGAEELQSVKAAVQVGRLDENQMVQVIPDFDLVIDATHPYAVEVTKHVRNACHTCGIPLRRLLRAESETGGCIRVDSCAQACDLLSTRPGNVLLTTGAKELSSFRNLEPERVFARVLPTHPSLDACEDLGLPHRNIIALQGPFSEEMNAAMLAQYHIRWLVTKDGGKAGGFDEKLRAAHRAGADVILVGRRAESGLTMEEILKELEARE